MGLQRIGQGFESHQQDSVMDLKQGVKEKASKITMQLSYLNIYQTVEMSQCR